MFYNTLLYRRITSATTLGALLGGLVADAMSDWTGRRLVFRFAVVIFIGGAIGLPFMGHSECPSLRLISRTMRPSLRSRSKAVSSSAHPQKASVDSMRDDLFDGNHDDVEDYHLAPEARRGELLDAECGDAGCRVRRCRMRGG